MNKIFNTVIEVFYWLTIFASPFLAGALIGVIVFLNNEHLLWVSIAFISIGMIMGVVLAERIRRKFGCSQYIGRILTTRAVGPPDGKKNK